MTANALYGVVARDPARRFLRSVDRPSDGKVSELLKLEFQPRPDLSVSPDEQYVLLAKPDEKGTDLMLLEGFR